MLEIAKEFVEMSTYVEERPASDENTCDDIEVVQSVKTKCYEETKYLTAKEDRRDEEGSSRRDRVRGSHTWTEEERIIAFHCLLRYGKDFDAVAEVLGTKTSDKVKSFYSDMKQDIDKLLEKEAEKEAEMISTFDMEHELSLEGSKNVEIVNLE
ncbi:Myb-like DNA-binding domain protein [Cooperia oncophora]